MTFNISVLKIDSVIKTERRYYSMMWYAVISRSGKTYKNFKLSIILVAPGDLGYNRIFPYLFRFKRYANIYLWTVAHLCWFFLSYLKRIGSGCSLFWCSKSLAAQRKAFRKENVFLERCHVDLYSRFVRLYSDPFQQQRFGPTWGYSYLNFY